MSKYTKGPWVLDEFSDEQWDICIEREEDFLVICEMTSAIESSTTKLTAEDKANARLIAAAPELLEALQQAVGSLEWAASVIGDIPPKCDYIERIEEAKAIIAKATGETK